MNSQKFGSIKVPPFDRANYNLWNKKMTLFIRATNPLYMGILENNPFVPMWVVEASVVDGVRIDAGSVPKDPSEITPPEKEFMALDTSLQLFIVDSMDSNMCH